MTAWAIAWLIGLYAVVSVVCLAFVAVTEREAAEKFDTEWSDR